VEKKMIKIIPPNAQDFEESRTQIIKISSQGISGQDLSDFIKRAGNEFVHLAKKVQFYPGEVPIHLIALGATEYYGPNRNGDGFSVKTCKKYHNTFVKHAHFYRNHINKNPQKSYGIVKLSYYNNLMHRIELLVALNGTKQAADRNGGLVADQELNKLESGKDIGVSMACYVPFDQCSVCGNKAKSRDEYCRGVDEGGSCPGGGLFSKIATVTADGRQVYADNPNPKFFDISHVPRPADRIAWVLGTFNKNANSQNKVLSGAELAEKWGLDINDTFELIEVGDVYNPKPLIYIIKKLAQAEDFVEKNPRSSLNLAFSPSVQPVVDWTLPTSYQFDQALGSLTQEKIAAPLQAFLSLSVPRCDTSNVYIQAKPNLRGIYKKILNSNNIDFYVKKASNWRDFMRNSSQNIQKWAKKLKPHYSFDFDDVQKRIYKATLRGDSKYEIKDIEKTAGDTDDSIANLYAMYKVAFLEKLLPTEPNFNLLCELVVRQNYL
jgi:hypothetical protein